MKRICGTMLILAGAAMMIGLTSLFYAPIPDVGVILVALGMPGVLLGALSGILCLGAGVLIILSAERGRARLQI